MPFWAKYATATTFQFPMIKRGVVDFAQTGDWTPASTDAAISKDNGAYADTANTIAIVTGSPTRGVSMFKLALSTTELTCAVACVQIVDAATKAVEDQSFEVYTYGNASAFFAGDWSDIAKLGLTNLDATITSRLAPTVAARTLDVSAGGEAGLDWANVGSPTTTVDLSGTTIKTTQKVDVDTIKTNPVVNAGTITFPTTATLASTTNITAGTMTTTTNLTTNNDKTGYSLLAGQLFIKKNTALANFEFIMTDSTTHAPKTGVTVTTTRNIDNAGFGATTNSASEVGNGWYTINLAAADLNGTVIAFRFTGASSDDLNFTVITQA